MAVSTLENKGFEGPVTAREAILIEEIGRLEKTIILKDEIIDTYRKITEDMASKLVELRKILEAKHG